MRRIALLARSAHDHLSILADLLNQCSVARSLSATIALITRRRDRRYDGAGSEERAVAGEQEEQRARDWHRTDTHLNRGLLDRHFDPYARIR